MSPTFIKRKRGAKFVAHRGLSSAERENTVAAFVAAANRSYWGIESDVRLTSDGKFVMLHDSHTGRVAFENLAVSETPFDVLRSLVLKDKNGCAERNDLRIPSLAEYISVCRAYGKKSVLEIKGRFPDEKLEELKNLLADMGQLDDTVFIAFDMGNLIYLRQLLPDHPMQFLTEGVPKTLIGELSSRGFGLDVAYPAVTRELAKALKKAGVELNCWTVNDAGALNRLLALKADYVTTEVFE